MADHPLRLPGEALAGEGQQPQRFARGTISTGDDNFNRPSFTDYWQGEKESERAGRVQFVNEGPPPASSSTMGMVMVAPPQEQQQQQGSSKFCLLLPQASSRPSTFSSSIPYWEIKLPSYLLGAKFEAGGRADGPRRKTAMRNHCNPGGVSRR